LQAPIVCLDTEGQFSFCGTSNLAGAILTAPSGGSFEKVKAWMLELGIVSLPASPYDLFEVDIRPSPSEFH